MIKAVETGNHSVMSPLELVLSGPENVSILGPVEKWELAVDENTPAEALRLLCLEDIGGQLSNEIANNPNSPSDAVQLAETRLMSSKERAETAKGTDNPYILEGLANDEDKYIREEVAWNPETAHKVLSKLAIDEDDTVRKGVASNPNTPLEILTMLANDDSKPVRIVVAYNRRTPYKVLKILTMDEDKDVRFSAYLNLAA